MPTAQRTRFAPHPFSGAQPVCNCGGRGQCFVCEATQAVRFAEMKQSAGQADTVGEFFANETLDRPFKANPTASLPYVRMVGNALGIDAMRNARPEDLSNPVVTRATNLAGMLTAGLLKLPADRRQAALEDVGGVAWAQEVLKGAAALNGKLPPTEAIQFILTLEFLVGYGESQRGVFSPRASAYVRAFNLAKGAQEVARADSLGITKRPNPSMGHYGGFGLTLGIPDSLGINIGTGGNLPVITDQPAIQQKTLVSNTLASGATLVPAAIRPTDWLRVSPNGRVILFITDKPVGMYVVMKVAGDPITYAEQVTADDILRNMDGAGAKQYKRLWSMTTTTPPVVPTPGQPVWGGIYPSGTSPISIEMSQDGILRFYTAPAGGALREAWTSRQAGVPSRTTASGVRVVVQDDGNVVGYRDNTVAFGLDTYKPALQYLSSLFVAPPDAAPNPAGFNTENCMWGAPQAAKNLAKADGIKIAFQRVFLRPPNNAEINYYGAMRWCIDKDGLLAGKKSTLEVAMETVRGQLIDGKVSNTTPPPNQNDLQAPPGSNPVLAWLDDAANWSTNILCQGFRALFPQAIADVICSIVQFFVRGAAAMVGSLLEVTLNVLKAVQALLEGIAGSAAALVTGDVAGSAAKLQKGILDFFRYLTAAVFFLTAANFIIPFLTDTDPNNKQAVSQAIERVRTLAYAAADKDPLFPLTLTINVITMVVAPTPQSAIQLAVTLVPVVAALVAPAIQRLPMLVGVAVAEIQKGLDSFLRLGLTVAMGVVAVADVVSSVRKNLAAKMQKDSAFSIVVCNMAGNIPKAPDDKTPPQPKNPAWCAAAVLKRLARAFDPNNPQSIPAAISRFKLDDIGAAVTSVLTLIPAILLALVGGAVESDLGLKALIDQWFINANAVPGMLSNATAADVRGAMTTLLDSLNAAQKTEAVREQERILDLQGSAKVVAKTLWARIGRDGVPDADRAAYYTAMREAWVAEGGVV